MASCQKFARYCRYSLNIFNQVVLKSGFLCAVRLFGRPNKKHAYIFVDKLLNVLWRLASLNVINSLNHVEYALQTAALELA